MSDEEWKTLVGDLHRAGNNLRHEGFLVDAATADAAGSAITNLLSALADPIAVHSNMLRGTIAKPTLEQIIHLYGVDALVKALAPVIVREADNEPS